MSHELRTPLNAVMGFAQLLQLEEDDPLSPNQRRRVALIHEAGGHLLHMIGELLDLTRIESGNLALECVDVRLEPLLVDCVEMLRPSAETADVRLLPIRRARGAGTTRLRQVVLNPVSNATAPTGRVDLRTPRQRVAGGRGVASPTPESACSRTPARAR
jgi:hypothetical protein